MSSTSSDHSFKAPPLSLAAPAPRRPALKIPLPPSPWGPPDDDLGALVSDAIKARPAPRRTLPEFKCDNLLRDPPPPPPTPAENTLLSARYSPSGTPRTSAESKRVSFLDVWTDDDGGSGRTSFDSDHESYRVST